VCSFPGAPDARLSGLTNQQVLSYYNLYARVSKHFSANLDTYFTTAESWALEHDRLTRAWNGFVFALCENALAGWRGGMNWGRSGALLSRTVRTFYSAVLGLLTAGGTDLIVAV
jgi:hypothetical protein